MVESVVTGGLVVVDSKNRERIGAEANRDHITFLLVALLQNSQSRNDQATQHKLNAIADGLADLMTHVAGESDGLHEHIAELRTAVGLEERESSSKNAE